MFTIAVAILILAGLTALHLHRPANPVDTEGGRADRRGVHCQPFVMEIDIDTRAPEVSNWKLVQPKDVNIPMKKAA